MKSITLLSTVVAPLFCDATIHLKRIRLANLPAALARVTVVRAGHAATLTVLREICPSLPPQEPGFWDGTGKAIAVRPRGGVRGAKSTGDTAVTLNDLEAVWVEFVPA